MLKEIKSMLKPLIKVAAVNENYEQIIDLVGSKVKVDEAIEREEKHGEQDNNG